MYGIPETTLRRYVKKDQSQYPVHGGRFKNVLSVNLEQQLSAYLREMGSRGFGLTGVQHAKLKKLRSLLTKQIHQWMTCYAPVVVKLVEQKIGCSTMHVQHGGMKLVQRIVAVVNSFAIYADKTVRLVIV
jgi:hypothetical protein